MTEKSFDLKEEISTLRARSHEFGTWLAKHEARMYDMDKERADIVSNVRELSAKVDNKVSFKTFTWVIGLMFGILTTILGIIWTEVKDIRVDIKEARSEDSKVAQAVSTIQGILQNAQITK